LDSLNGEFGKVKDLYFDDRFWTTRYLVADTGKWLSGRQVLLSPYSLGAVDREERKIAISLTREQIEASPSLDSEKPVSRQFEEDYYRYYGWPNYWNGGYGWGSGPYIERDRNRWADSTREENSWDPHLRSAHDVVGHHIEATDGAVGHVEDFIIDEETWAIRYLVATTRNWWPGRKILISPKWIERVSWNESKVYVNITRESVKQAPEYVSGSLPSRDFEESLHHHYARRGYWIDELAWHEAASR
jgi:hypothetical protein